MKNQLVPSITSESTSDLLSTIADSALDAAIDSGALDGISVVGLLTGFIKAARDIRERLLLKKLILFLKETENLSPEERGGFKSKFQDEAASEDFGTIVVMLLDRSDDLTKPKILGRLLVVYAQGHITQEDFLRLSSMVERSFSSDLPLLRGFTFGNWLGREAQAQNLASLGFLYQAGFDGGDVSDPNSGGILYQISQFGEWIVRYGLD